MFDYKCVIKVDPRPSDEFLQTWYAYHGDWEEYSKFKKSDEVDDAEELVVRRGCYFSLDFARWCKSNLKNLPETVSTAISAKFIMNNDLSYIVPNVYCIWYPELPTEETCRQLYFLHPEMKYQVVCVCVHKAYNALFKELNILPDEGLLTLAEENNNFQLVEYINTMVEKKKLWRILCDTNGIVQEPELCRIGGHPFECEVLPINEYKKLYEESVVNADDELDFDEPLSESYILYKADYYDPLSTGVVSDSGVREKLKMLGLDD